MARARSPARDEAKKLYLESKGKMKLVDIAARLNILDTQVRKWKSQDKWEQELKGMLPNNKRNVTNKKNIKKESIIEEVKEVVENSELTDKQKLFCIYYIRCFNATKAYQKAYDCKYDVANAEGYKLLVKPCVKEEIQKLKQAKLNRVMISEDDIFQKYIDIAFSDITDYLEFGQEEREVMGAFGPIKDEDGNVVTKIVNVVKFKSSNEIDGTLINEVKQGKDGASIKLQDKMKALQWLSDRLDLIPTLSREKLEIEKQKVEIARNKISNLDNDKENKIDEYFRLLEENLVEK